MMAARADFINCQGLTLIRFPVRPGGTPMMAARADFINCQGLTLIRLMMAARADFINCQGLTLIRFRFNLDLGLRQRLPGGGTGQVRTDGVEHSQSGYFLALVRYVARASRTDIGPSSKPRYAVRDRATSRQFSLIAPSSVTKDTPSLRASVT